MAGIAKTMGIMTATGLVGGAGISYLMQSRADNALYKQMSSISQNGKLQIGGQSPDGKHWDGQITLEEFKKNLSKKTMITSTIAGVVAAIGTAIISGLTLLAKSKL